MPAMPAGLDPEGILQGIYRFKAAAKGKAKVQLFGSGPILNEALRAQQILAEKYSVAADVWSVTSYNELRRDALDGGALEPPASRTSRSGRRTSLQALKGAEGPIVAASDYMKVVADQIAPWLPGRMETLGTDGFGRSDNREYLRRHFEINAESIVDGRAFAAGARRQVRRRERPRPPSPNWAWIPRRSTRAGLAPLNQMQTGQRVAAAGMLVSGALAVVKIAAGLAGHSTAVVADGLESAGDVFASGLRAASALTLAAKPADAESSLRPRPGGDADRPADRAGADRGRRADLLWLDPAAGPAAPTPLAAFVVWPLVVSLVAKTGLATHQVPLRPQAAERRADAPTPGTTPWIRSPRWSR